MFELDAASTPSIIVGYSHANMQDMESITEHIHKHSRAHYIYCYEYEWSVLLGIDNSGICICLAVTMSDKSFIDTTLIVFRKQIYRHCASEWPRIVWDESHSHNMYM